MNAHDKTRVELGELVHDLTTDSLPVSPTKREIEAQVDIAIDAILAAGYRKPRTITTAEELDALAEGSVILSNDGEDSAQKDGEGYWYLWGGDIGLCSEEINLPVTVLHEPDPS